MTAATQALPSEPLAKRVSPADGLRQTFTLAWRSLVSVKHNPFELLDLSIQPLMFVLLFTFVFGGAISGSPGDYRLEAVFGARGRIPATPDGVISPSADSPIICRHRSSSRASSSSSK